MNAGRSSASTSSPARNASPQPPRQHHRRHRRTRCRLLEAAPGGVAPQALRRPAADEPTRLLVLDRATVEALDALQAAGLVQRSERASRPLDGIPVLHTPRRADRRGKATHRRHPAETGSPAQGRQRPRCRRPPRGRPAATVVRTPSRRRNPRRPPSTSASQCRKRSIAHPMARTLLVRRARARTRRRRRRRRSKGRRSRQSRRVP